METYKKRKLAEGDNDWNKTREDYSKLRPHLLQDLVQRRYELLLATKQCNAWMTIEYLLDFVGNDVGEGVSTIYFPLRTYVVGNESEPLESFIEKNLCTINNALRTCIKNVSHGGVKCILSILESENYSGEHLEYVHAGIKCDTSKTSSYMVKIVWVVKKLEK